MFITVEDEKLVFLDGGDELKPVATFVGPDFEQIWALLDGPREPYLNCSSSVDDPENARFAAIVDGMGADWLPCDDEEHAQFLGFTCKVTRKDNGKWIAWASRNGACRVLDRGDERFYETERAARADALRLAYEDTYTVEGA